MSKKANLFLQWEMCSRKLFKASSSWKHPIRLQALLKTELLKYSLRTEKRDKSWWRLIKFYQIIFIFPSSALILFIRHLYSYKLFYQCWRWKRVKLRSKGGSLRPPAIRRPVICWAVSGHYFLRNQGSNRKIVKGLRGFPTRETARRGLILRYRGGF